MKLLKRLVSGLLAGVTALTAIMCMSVCASAESTAINVKRWSEGDDINLAVYGDFVKEYISQCDNKASDVELYMNISVYSDKYGDYDFFVMMKDAEKLSNGSYRLDYFIIHKEDFYPLDKFNVACNADAFVFKLPASDNIAKAVNEMFAVPYTAYLKVGNKYVIGNDNRRYGFLESADKKETTSKPSAPKTLKVIKSAEGKAKISWSKVNGADGYVVYMADKKDGKYSKIKTVTKNSTVSLTKSKLTTGKTYYFKVRSYKTVDGKKVYSKYSGVKSIKV